CGCDFSAQCGDNYHGWQSHPADEDRIKTFHPWDGLAIRGISIVAAVAAEGSLRNLRHVK
ncbi:MAG: hypothetical protein QGF00_13415, partial [Planctomycetota bacterium]|nr:hypothetical protein [Planctomycetota bacterium]